MALFGKKAAATPPADVPSTVAVAPNGDPVVIAPDGNGAPVAAKGRRAKAPAAPRKSAAKSGTVVGLNIGNAFIKAVEVTSRGGQLTVTGMGVIATPPESYSNGNVLSLNALSGALRTLWKQAGLSSKATIFSVAGTGSLVVRVIEVPKMTDGELADNMRVDADRYIPFPPSEVVMDFKALRDLPSDPDAANMEVLLAAAQREIIDLHVGVVQKARLTPRAIDVEPLALARTMQLGMRAQGALVDYDDVIAVLNIGLTGTEISILRGDIVVFTRSIPNGGANLTNAIAESMGIPPSDAERLKIERGDALPPGGYADDNQGDFGDFGAFDDAPGDTSGLDFDTAFDDESVTGVAPTTTTTTAAPVVSDAPAATESGSDDPFDLDFFDQGPQQSQPGAGHGQREDDDDDASAGINFSFDELDDDFSPSRASNTPATPAPSAPAPNAAPNMEDLDLSDDYLPAMDASVTPASPPPATGFSMPSAFDFSDFDLPATEKSAAPTQKLSEPETDAADQAAAAPVATPAAPKFGFSMEKPVESAAPAASAPVAEELVVEPDTTMQVSLDKADAPVVEAAAADEIGTDDTFDLDDVFGDAPAAATPVAATPVAATTEAVGDGGFDANVFGDGADEVTFDLGANADDDDFTTFGTGLSQTGETDDNTLYAAMQPVLDDLATEVRRSLEFHLGRYPDTTFSRLVLVGGGAKLRNLDEFLTANLGVPASVGDSFSHIAVNVPGLPSEFVPTNAPLCAVALGLALRDFIE